MLKPVTIDELIVTLTIPATLPDAAAEAVWRVLLGRAFTTRMRAAVRAVVRADPQLARVRVTLSR